PLNHKKDFVPRYQQEEQIPPSLQDAILTFVLACAARAARGQTNSHNSMLIHVSRFKDVHQKVFGQVDEWLANLKRVLKFRTGGAELISRLNELRKNDFESTFDAIRQTELG